MLALGPCRFLSCGLINFFQCNLTQIMKINVLGLEINGTKHLCNFFLLKSSELFVNYCFLIQTHSYEYIFKESPLLCCFLFHLYSSRIQNLVCPGRPKLLEMELHMNIDISCIWALYNYANSLSNTHCCFFVLIYRCTLGWWWHQGQSTGSYTL